MGKKRYPLKSHQLDSKRIRISDGHNGTTTDLEQIQKNGSRENTKMVEHELNNLQSTFLENPQDEDVVSESSQIRSDCDDQTSHSLEGEDAESNASDDHDELIYSKTQKECTSQDNEIDSDDEKHGDEQDNEDLEGEFEMFDPSDKFYHGIRHFISESVLSGLASKDVSKRRSRHYNKAEGKNNNLDSGDKGGSGDKGDRGDKGDSANAAEGDEERHQSGERHRIKPSVDITQIAPLASRLADCICNQVNIGTVISLPDEDEIAKRRREASVVGFVTLLNFRQYPKDGLDEVGRALVSSAKKRLSLRQAQAFESLLFPSKFQRPMSTNKQRLLEKRQYRIAQTEENTEVALFLNERMVNSPHEIVPDAFKCLREDVKWTQTTELDAEEEKERKFYFFTHVVGISRCFISPSITAVTKDSPSNAKDKSKTKSVQHDDSSAVTSSQLRFPKFEDEVFVANSELYFTIPTNLRSRVPKDTQSNKLIDVQEQKLVFLMTFKKFVTAIKQINSLVKETTG